MENAMEMVLCSLFRKLLRNESLQRGETYKFLEGTSDGDFRGHRQVTFIKCLKIHRKHVIEICKWVQHRQLRTVFWMFLIKFKFIKNVWGVGQSLPLNSNKAVLYRILKYFGKDCKDWPPQIYELTLQNFKFLFYS